MTLTQPPPPGTCRPITQLRSTGLLWLINRTVFHPRGLALALVTDAHGTVAGWQLVGDGSQPYRFEDDDDQSAFAAAAAELAAHIHRDPATLSTAPATAEYLGTDQPGTRNVAAAAAAAALHSDPALLDMLRELFELEQLGERAELHIGPFSGYELIAALQLVLRHPEVTGGLRTRIEQLARQMADGWFTGAIRSLIEQGFDPANDTVWPAEQPDHVGPCDTGGGGGR